MSLIRRSDSVAALRAMEQRIVNDINAGLYKEPPNVAKPPGTHATFAKGASWGLGLAAQAIADQPAVDLFAGPGILN